jgi:hypothetical protein
MLSRVPSTGMTGAVLVSVVTVIDAFVQKLR